MGTKVNIADFIYNTYERKKKY
ncbi:hypothetical protein P6F46_27925 (plasmid) [Bacillus shihchuchen]|uniref:Uncharacterized protein n=1 Tax=Bacillus shihchuchen TaxID=3036942 RepID=A0ABT7L0H4_9BACI|nr:hypothetical protein [Bacillus shihchuchen]